MTSKIMEHLESRSLTYFSCDNGAHSVGLLECPGTENLHIPRTAFVFVCYFWTVNYTHCIALCILGAVKCNVYNCFDLLLSLNAHIWRLPRPPMHANAYHTYVT